MARRSTGLDATVAGIMEREIPNPPYSFSPPHGLLANARLVRSGAAIRHLEIPDTLNRHTFTVMLTDIEFMLLARAFPGLVVNDG